MSRRPLLVHSLTSCRRRRALGVAWRAHLQAASGQSGASRSRAVRPAACVRSERTTRWCVGVMAAHAQRAAGLLCCTNVANSRPRGSLRNSNSPLRPSRPSAARRTKPGSLLCTSQPSTRRGDEGDPSFKPSAVHPVTRRTGPRAERPGAPRGSIVLECARRRSRRGTRPRSRRERGCSAPSHPPAAGSG